jgi:hypothetical protein
MRLHSRNRKRKLDIFMGDGKSDGGYPYSMSLADNSVGGTQKRLRTGDTTMDDDDI